MISVRPARQLIFSVLILTAPCSAAHAQEAFGPPAYLAAVNGVATLDRNGDEQPAVRDMPFVPGDRIRTANGRVEIDFPDGSAIEVGPDSEVESLSPTRVRLLAGTMDHLPRRDGMRTVSSNYIPADLREYGAALDQNGSWDYDESYGYVWYPRVAAGWRPYYYGSWSPVPNYGWTWIGLDAWSWPTHHYGRWGFARNAWFWIPGRTWGAAWVSWALAPDYVSWCPTGFDGRPVFALSAGVQTRVWSGWTVMPRGYFGDRRYLVPRYAADPRRFVARTPFVQTARLPLTIGRDRAAVDARTGGMTDFRRVGPLSSSSDRRPMAAGPGATSAARRSPDADARSATAGIRRAPSGSRAEPVRPRSVPAGPRVEEIRPPVEQIRPRAEESRPPAAPERTHPPENAAPPAARPKAGGARSSQPAAPHGSSGGTHASGRRR